MKVNGKVGPNGDVQARIGDEMVTSAAHVIRNGDVIHIFEGEGCKHSQLQIPVVKYDTGASSKGALTAPMPGKIIQLLVGSKQVVKKGEPIVIMEAMKMEVSNYLFILFSDRDIIYLMLTALVSFSFSHTTSTRLERQQMGL